MAAVLGLALAGYLAAAVIGPRQARTGAERAAERDVGVAAAALGTRCEQVADLADATAREVAGYATVGALDRAAAARAAGRAAGHRPQAAFAVFDPAGGLLAVAGNPAGTQPAAAGGYGASCATGSAGRAGSAGAGLAERVPVYARPGGGTRVALVANVVVWYPLDTAALRGLRAGVGATGQLAVLDRNGRLLASTDSKERARSPQERARRGPGPGLPYALVAAVPVDTGPLPRWPLLAIGALAVLSPWGVRRVASWLTRPTTDQLTAAVGEVRAGEAVLADTFTRFGEALEHTHDLDGLLDAIATACARGTGAAAALALVVERGADDLPRLEQRGGVRLDGLNGPEGPGGRRAQSELAGFAEGYFHRLTGSGAPTSEPAQVGQLATAGPVIAVPIRTEHALVGVLALARGAGARGFDALALPRVRALADHAGTAIENVRRHEEARRLSVTDPLTGVGNVRQLSAVLQREVAGAIRFDRRLTVLMLDLDHFKQVNDSLGHPFGDIVLRDVARRLLAVVREMDSVARYGGEEFAIVLPDTDAEGGVRVAERVMNEIRREPFGRAEVWRQVTVSIGVATFPEHGHSAADVLQAADGALYAAKRAGRDRWEIAGGTGSASAVSQAG